MASFGDYEIRGELARGNMGVVYRAYDAVRQCDVALKRLANPQSEREAQRFRVEVEAAARLRHPHVVGIHAAGEDERGLWLAMDLIEGESLFARIQRGPLHWTHALRIALQLCDALSHAHALGVLHRDLKPHNVLLDVRGDAFLTDFGLARLVEEDLKLTQEGDVLGTPVYMAPEQALSQLERFGPHTDVYGLGATLFHALTAQPPFYDRRLSVLLRQVAEQPVAVPSSLGQEIPPELDTAIQRCMAKAPEDRYASAAELRVALGRVGAEDASGAQGIPRWALPAAAGAALGAVTVVAGLAWWNTSRRVSPPPPPPPPQAALPAPAKPPAPEVEPEPEPPLRPVADLKLEVARSLDGFDTRHALALAMELRERAPTDGEVHLLLAEARAELGSFDEAWKEFQRALELDLSLRGRIPRQRLDLIRDYAEQTDWEGVTLPERWQQAFGGVWSLGPNDEVLAGGGGLGTYQLSALFDTHAPAEPSYELEVEVNRDPLGEGQARQGYAGVILAARHRGDFYTVFFVQNRTETDDMLAESGGAEAYRQKHGVEPVVLRVTHQRGRRWEFPARGGVVLPPQRGPWSKLRLKVSGRLLQAWVSGEQVLELELERPLQGRVGMTKYYFQDFRWRNWSVTPL